MSDTDTAELEIKTREMRPEQKLHHWGSPKRQRTLSLTDYGWEVISDIADQYKLNRSEVIEIIARMAKENGDDLIEERYTLLA
tara:strand:- start:367 stop:615 length:249 start_codon:yes stop_codon:yes gene_type:complete